MTKIINNTYEDFLKQSDKALRMSFRKMGRIGDAILTANGGSGYKRMFDNFKKDIQNKVNRKEVRFLGSSPRSTIRNPRLKRRSLMNRAS
tara:strand:- start:113 stop:382 length:270 start_codon:yes stop_codon:yes gene_type:complete